MLEFYLFCLIWAINKKMIILNNKICLIKKPDYVKYDNNKWMLNICKGKKGIFQ